MRRGSSSIALLRLGDGSIVVVMAGSCSGNDFGISPGRNGSEESVT